MNGVNKKRRQLLIVATSFTAGVGAVGLSIPFVQSMQPSARALVAGAPVKVDISKIEPGRMITVKWQGKPVWILRRTETNLKNLALRTHRNNLRDPDSTKNQQPEYVENEYRSLRPDIFLAVGICTHLGCVPSYMPDGKAEVSNAIYFCPCHGSKFDLAGRVFKAVPAPANLVIPPHQYIGEDTVHIGVDENVG
jgi:ubiquinol-cytochrome c reductase iron-sulfur subunit